MRNVSAHLGQVIVAIACVALLITAVTFFKAPIGDFFTSIVNKEASLGDSVLDKIENIEIGVNGSGKDNTPGIQYMSFEDALGETNAVENGKVKMYGDDTNRTLVLLEDYESDAVIRITKGCTIKLNGNTLEFTANKARINIDTAEAVTIDGSVSGSAVIKNLGDASVASETLVTISTDGSNLTVNKGTYSISANGGSKTVAAFASTKDTSRINFNGCKINVDYSGTNSCKAMQLRGVTTLTNCEINVKSPTQGVAVDGLHLFGSNPTTINNCTIKADGYGDTVSAPVSVSAILDSAESSVTINGGYYYGTREALSLNGTARINGGIFEGCQHGGAYFQSSDVKVKNAKFRNVDYTGDCGWNAEHYGVVYLGSLNRDVTVYMDNCTLEREVYTSHGIALSSSSNMKNTSLYISNTDLTAAGGNIRVDGVNGSGGSGHLYVGENVAYSSVTGSGTIDTTTWADKNFADWN